MSYLSAVEGYRSWLDSFKLLLGLPLGERIALTALGKVGLRPLPLDERAGYIAAVAGRLDVLNAIDQYEDSKRLFNFVLGSIAAISLLVGGIGIMNIMLATVTERTREIGIRRALGAKREQIITQFLTETGVLSIVGGLIGVMAGIFFPYFLSWAIEAVTDNEYRIVVTLWSVLLAFGISVATGIVFGVYPALRAADLDPIEALRHN